MKSKPRSKAASSTRPTTIDAALLRRWPLPELAPELGKEARGRVLVVGGSAQNPGGVLLAAVGALRAGAGKLQIATARDVALAVAVALPEARVIGLAQQKNGELAPESCRAVHAEMQSANAILVGPGMMDGRAAVRLLTHCVGTRTRAPLVVDAAALAAFEGRAPLPDDHAAGVIATPHAGEMARLWGVPRDEVLGRAHELTREAAARLRVVVALKGAETFVAAPDGRSFSNRAGNLGLGTSGSGDTLSGIIAGLCARGAEPLQATVWGIHLHALAGERLARRVGPLGFLARELLGEIPPLLAELGS